MPLDAAQTKRLAQLERLEGLEDKLIEEIGYFELETDAFEAHAKAFETLFTTNFTTHTSFSRVDDALQKPLVSVDQGIKVYQGMENAGLNITIESLLAQPIQVEEQYNNILSLITQIEKSLSLIHI